MATDRGKSDRIARQVLEPGEKLLWSGRPGVTGYVLRFPQWVVVLFGAGAATGGLFMLAKTIAGNRFVRSGESGPYLGETGHYIFSLGFLAFGLLLLSGVFGWALEARRTVYAITDRRLLSLNRRKDPPKILRQWGALPLSLLEHTGSGRGHVLFDYQSPPEKGTATIRIGFFSVPEPETVKRLITEQRYAPGKSADWLASPISPSLPTTSRTASDRELPCANLAPVLRKLLLDGERVLWHGKPDHSAYLKKQVKTVGGSLLIWYAVLFFFGGLPQVHLSMEDNGVIGLIFSNFFLLFWVGPLVSVIIVFVFRIRKPPPAEYAVTSIRALVSDTDERNKPIARAIDPQRVASVSVSSGEAGTLKFRLKSGEIDSQQLPSKFCSIPEPKRVARLIREQPWAKGIEFKGLD